MTRSNWKLPTAVMVAGGLIAAVMATNPAFGVNRSPAAGSAVRILSATNIGPTTIANTVQTIVTLKVPAGHWLVSGKLWAASGSMSLSQDTKIGCAIAKAAKPSARLDNSIIDLPKVSGTGSSAGVIDLTVVLTLRSPAKLILGCADFDTVVTANNAVLAAIGG
jgi:hypothetical protein